MRSFYKVWKNASGMLISANPSETTPLGPYALVLPRHKATFVAGYSVIAGGALGSFSGFTWQGYDTSVFPNQLVVSFTGPQLANFVASVQPWSLWHEKN